MTDLIIQLSEATAGRTVDRIVEQNINQLRDPLSRIFFCRFANSAKIRINRIKREQKKSYFDLLN